jgi:hypothetical protein
VLGFVATSVFLYCSELRSRRLFAARRGIARYALQHSTAQSSAGDLDCGLSTFMDDYPVYAFAGGVAVIYGTMVGYCGLPARVILGLFA